MTLENVVYSYSIFAQGGGSPSGYPTLIIMGLLFIGMWFLLIAPQRKRQKEHAKMIETLQSGDEIVTAGGIYGTITNVKEDRFVVKIADNTKIEINKSSIQAKLNNAVPAKAE